MWRPKIAQCSDHLGAYGLGTHILPQIGLPKSSLGEHKMNCPNTAFCCRRFLSPFHTCVYKDTNVARGNGFLSMILFTIDSIRRTSIDRFSLASRLRNTTPSGSSSFHVICVDV